MALAAPSRQARSILETTGLTKVFPVYGTEAEAVQACRSRQPNRPDPQRCADVSTSGF